MDKFVKRFGAAEQAQPRTESESASDFKPPPWKTAALAGESSLDDLAHSSSSSSGSSKIRA